MPFGKQGLISGRLERAAASSGLQGFQTAFKVIQASIAFLRHHCFQFPRQPLENGDAFLMQPYPDALRDRYDHMAVASMEEQRRIERSDTMPFEEYRRQYVSPERLGLRPGAVMVGAESP